MRTIIIFITIFLMSVLVSSSPIDPKRHLVNRPRDHHLTRRSAPAKGGRPGVKGYHPTPFPNLRKGEYICGDRVCKLMPGEVPKGCNGICQYRVR